MKYSSPPIRNVTTRLNKDIRRVFITRKRFARANGRLLLLAGFLLGVLGVTRASPTSGPILETIGRRPIGLVIPSTLGAYPTTTIPLSTDTTVTPDAAPTNTTSMNVSASTNFKGVLEANPATGVVRVTDAHPAGTYTVTVAGFSSTGVRTSTTFALTVTTPATCLPVSFAAATNFGIIGADVTFPLPVAVGDFNGDGKQDLVTANGLNASVSIFLGDGAGNFSVATNFGGVYSARSVAVGDFNGDGKQDLVTANEGTYNVAILLGDGAGNFSAAVNFPAGSYPSSVAVGDFNGDGKQDLAVTNFVSNNVSILLGDGTGNFSGPTNFAAGDDPWSVAVGDFNGDGKPDLATANDKILLGDGAGNFSAATDFGDGHVGFSVAVGDFNGDGKQDLAIVSGSAGVWIVLGDGAGGFGAATGFGAGSRGGFSAVVGDFNGDGKQDLAIPNYYSNNVSILLGDGAGNFSGPANFGTPPYPISPAVGDFNGDGKQDLVVSSQGVYVAPTVSILLRVCDTDECTVCHKHTTTITGLCNSLELQRHRDHGDPPGACQSN